MSAPYSDQPGYKRSRSRSPPPWSRSHKVPRQQHDGQESLSYRPAGRGRHDNKYNSNHSSHTSPRDNYNPQRHHQQLHADTKDQMRLNRLQEDEQARQWVAQEDTFVLTQAKKKAEIRVKEGRAKPIDWLAVTLRVIDTTRNPLDDEISDSDLDLIDPEGVLEGLSQSQLLELEKDIDTFLSLETAQKNRDFWKTMKVVCRDRQNSLSSAPQGRVLSSVAADINNILKPKSFEELEKLEVQVKRKLNSNDPIDTDYWEELLRSLTVWKARAKLKKVYQAVIEERVQTLRKQQQEEAESVRTKLAPIAPFVRPNFPKIKSQNEFDGILMSELDPEPRLNLRPEDKSLQILDESAFLEQVAHERQKVLKMGYVPLKQRNVEKAIDSLPNENSVTKDPVSVLNTRFSSIPNEDFSQATKALYEREVARGVSENEEIFTAEETISTDFRPLWANKYRPRKPRYFNRVQMGYEWNKYNQTHYDHDNPPPKVVQGYKFNIFYPDLIDKTKAPTYKIEREHGRKKGQSFVPAGEEDTCLIRFIAGPPYEDIAFRIVDKEWDYSAKRDRGFRSSFEKGILQLHFQFKRIYYRK